MANALNIGGKIKSVSADELTNPPKTTTAKGLCTSDPTPGQNSDFKEFIKNINQNIQDSDIFKKVIKNGFDEVMEDEEIEKYIKDLLPKMQQNIFDKALAYRQSVTREVNSYDEFKEEIEKGGFLLCHWDGTPETEEKIKEETKATIRCIPLDGDKTPGKCMVTGRPSAQRVVFARAY